MSVQQIEIKIEKERRKGLFNAISSVEIARDIEPRELQKLGVYGGAAGIWVNTDVTRDIVFKGAGVAVSILCTGKHYNDQFTDSGVEYDFPKTQRTGRHDENEINAILACNVSMLPIFVISKSKDQKLRDVRIGIVESLDLKVRKAYIKFVSLNVFESYPNEVEETQEKYHMTFEREVERSFQESNEIRRSRLKKANRKAQKTFRKVVGFVRNPDVVAEALHRAKGCCEFCKADAPFISMSTNTPYLEVHHIKPLSKDGDDTLENVLALCPNCHREKHFGKTD